MSEQLTPYLLLAGFLFCTGVFGLLSRHSVIGILISLEIILNSVNINLVAFGKFSSTDGATGQIFATFVIGLAAAEAAIGLSLIVALYRRFKSIDIEKPSELRG